MDIIVDEAVRDRVPTLFVRTRSLGSVRVEESGEAQEERIRAIATRWEGTPEQKLDSHPHIRIYRRLTQQMGGDPKKSVPAAEALLRRGLLRGRFPRINSVVDAGNIASVEYLVPIGLFDLDKISGKVELTLATDDHQMIPIGKNEPIKLASGTPVLKDSEGVFSAVGSRDSARTMITSETKSVLIFSWGMKGVEPAVVDSALDECAREILERST
ncbi:MAG: hypothetical protein IRY88_15450 [Rubrobacteraceae bacterium]|uniref:B3/B4 domain-containing protein n=1 Tax=Rubrobacter naiadicus TaxID=1392641 RepID=UPI0023607C64|nr:phenylalanine--tRNA ligase beta subunit-related protein [Rubrobacter naiadicus]MBX6765052.1 hypothetical protein [Rubrobacteraceae bacterium]